MRKGLTLTQDGLKLKTLPQLPKCRGTGCLPHPLSCALYLQSQEPPPKALGLYVGALTLRADTIPPKLHPSPHRQQTGKVFNKKKKTTQLQGCGLPSPDRDWGKSMCTSFLRPWSPTPHLNHCHSHPCPALSLPSLSLPSLSCTHTHTHRQANLKYNPEGHPGLGSESTAGY